MNDGDLLLAAVRANPDDDTPRLIYADYLQEHGDDPRAEFIRLQIRMAREFGAPPPRTCAARFAGACDCGECRFAGDWERATRPLTSRLAELQTPRNVRRWLSGYGALTPFVSRNPARGYGWCLHPATNEHHRAYVTFHRGFPHSVRCRWWMWCSYANTMRSAPVKEVRLRDEVRTFLIGPPDTSGGLSVALSNSGARYRLRNYQSHREAVPHLLKADYPGVTFVNSM